VLIQPRGGLGAIPRTDGLRSFHMDDGMDAEGNPRTDRLGIACSQLSTERAYELGLDAGAGLEIMDVVPGSIASILGLRSGDVVTEINGTAIRSADDVKKVLADRSKDGEVAVAVVGEGGDRRTMTWKPKASDAAEKPSGKKRGSRDL